MTILHINNDYIGTSVYRQLYSQLDELGIKQIVYVPLNYLEQVLLGKEVSDFKVKGSKVIVSTILKKKHRFFYRDKIDNILRDIERLGLLDEDISLVHTSTWCLTGAVAYELNKKYQLPYIISVRNTDVNVYYKFLFWNRNYFFSILKAASKVIFISKAYEKRIIVLLEKRYCSNDLLEISGKLMFMPNGIHMEFINGRKFKENLSEPINVLYVGGIQKNKNLLNVWKAIAALRARGYNITYTVIGKNLAYRNDDSNVEEMEILADKSSWFRICDAVNHKKLCELMNQYDLFVMPSFKETFGVAYLEALSQGLPIIYSMHEGFDDLYPEGEIGYHVDPHDIHDISNKILAIIKNYNSISKSVAKMNIDLYSWKNIALKYTELYSSLL